MRGRPNLSPGIGDVERQGRRTRAAVTLLVAMLISSPAVRHSRRNGSRRQPTRPRQHVQARRGPGASRLRPSSGTLRRVSSCHCCQPFVLWTRAVRTGSHAEPTAEGQSCGSALARLSSYVAAAANHRAPALECRRRTATPSGARSRPSRPVGPRPRMLMAS